MGLPYSKQINEAFDQVTPLVAEGFKVLETTKNISILLATIQVLNTIFLLLILAALVALLIIANPDLENERRLLITPTLQWFTAWVTDRSSRRYLALVISVVVGGVFVGAFGALYMMRKTEMEAVVHAEQQDQDSDAGANAMDGDAK